MTSLASNLDSNVPNPPRYWWTKRIVAACLGMLLALGGAWGIWWKVAERRLASAIEGVRARGEPILPEDFNTPGVPDDQNVAEYLKQAISVNNPNVDSPRSSSMTYEPYLPMTAEWYAMARDARAGNTKALELSRQAMQFTKVDWNIPFKSPVINTLLPSLNGMRHLANVVSDVALYEHLMGNDVEAVARLHEVFHAGHAVDQQPILVSRLVAIGIYALNIHSINIMGPGLRIEGDPRPAPTTQPATPVSREQVRSLIRILLERAGKSRMTTAFQMERMAAMDNTEWMTAKSVLLKPMYRLDQVNMIQVMGPVIDTAILPNLPAAAAAKNPYWDKLVAKPRWTTVMSNSLVPSLNQVMKTEFRVRAEAAMAAVILASRLYQIDHGGQFPPNLEALVPEYLPAVPVDLMSATGSPLGYLLLKEGTRPLVYSVGVDGVDDTRRGTLPGATPQTEFDPRAPDQWRDLSRFDPPPPPPATGSSPQ